MTNRQDWADIHRLPWTFFFFRIARKELSTVQLRSILKNAVFYRDYHKGGLWFALPA